MQTSTRIIFKRRKLTVTPPTPLVLELRSIFLMLAVVCTPVGVLAQSNYTGYNAQGQYVQGGQVQNNQGDAYQQAHIYPHQDQHTMQNPEFFNVGAVGVSNSTTPGYVQGTLGQVEAAANGAGGASGRTAVITYYDANPYQAGGTAQNQQNYTTYQHSLLQAPSAGYNLTVDANGNSFAADGVSYLAKPTPDSDESLTRTFMSSMPGALVFQAAKLPSDGKGAVVGQVTIDADTLQHLSSLRNVAGSNLYLNFFTPNRQGDANSFIGAVVLNPAVNTDVSLDPNSYTGYNQAAQNAQTQTAQTGNESGFFLGRNDVTQWDNGTPDNIYAPYNPNATFHGHTHPGVNGLPSTTDMISAATLGIPGAVISPIGPAVGYGFVQNGGLMRDASGGIGFGADAGETDSSSRPGDGRHVDNSGGVTRGTFSGDIGRPGSKPVGEPGGGLGPNNSDANKAVIATGGFWSSVKNAFESNIPSGMYQSYTKDDLAGAIARGDRAGYLNMADRNMRDAAGQLGANGGFAGSK